MNRFTSCPAERKVTRQVHVGPVSVGGGASIRVQSMTCTRTENVAATVDQILDLENAGCEIIRVAVPTLKAAEGLAKIKTQIHIPLVADIHFDHRLALRALDEGADKIRINPGNIGGRDRFETVLKAASRRGVPVRIGVNAGSLEKALLEKHGGVTAGGLVESAMNHIRICEEAGFTDLVISIKASDIPLMIEANRLLSEKTDYPLHLGVTEAGTEKEGILRSAVGIGTLLAEGIGDTIRISLTGDPAAEVKAAYGILKALHLRKRGITMVSCPTCGRTRIDLVQVVEKIEKALENENKSLTVAVMGCEVNGPGEAREADIGVACGKKTALLFSRGETIRKIKSDEIVDAIVTEVRNWTPEHGESDG